MSPLLAALRVLTYPVLTGGAVLFAWFATRAGWAPWVVGAVVVTVTSVVAEVLEHVIPYRRAWALPRRRNVAEFRTDLWHFAVSNRFVDIGTFAALASFGPLGAAAARWTGGGIWPTSWPLLAQAVLGLVIFELPWYWAHRLEHTRPLLWRLHSVHHSAPRMYWWNLSRNHPLDNLGSTFAAVAVLAFVGIPEQAFALVAAFSGAHGMLQHANIDLRTGFLDWVFTTPRVHRWHHSTNLEESMANYGPTLTLWDWVFGTRHFDAAAVPPEVVGLAPMPHPFPADYAGQLRAPFARALWSAGG
jgi:sterol desaturase/sphingolipid hydroxylase (fatty acid hydroxylase superfamily)